MPIAVLINLEYAVIRLINAFLDVERIESGKTEIIQQTCKTAEFMKNAANVMPEMAENLGVKLLVSPLSTEVWPDSDRII
jgi:signal transduction histidine kinase